jgi:DedD protein
MNDHHLDDLIIGDPEPATANSKTVLSIVALAIVVVVVGAVVYSLLFGSSDSSAPEAPAATAQERPLDPALTPLEPAETPAAQSTRSAASQSQTTPTAPEHTPEPAPKIEPPKPTPAPRSEPTPEPAPKPAPAVQPSAPVSSATATTAPGKELIKNADRPIYYIQVGAFRRDPSPKFMRQLKEAGFTFITKTSNGIRRVRVGPYDSYDEAKAALPEVKQKIGVDGLIVKY